MSAPEAWVECPTCSGTGCIHTMDGLRLRRMAGRVDPCCPDCAAGLVPPDGMTEAAARWAHTEMGQRSGVGLTWEAAYPSEQADYMRIASHMLVAARRWLDGEGKE